MNTEMFYRGLLHELEKHSNETPRKRSMFSNPMFWGGLGLAGLGGYGLWRGMQGAAPAPAQTSQAAQPASAGPTPQAAPHIPSMPETNRVLDLEHNIDKATMLALPASIMAQPAGTLASKAGLQTAGKALGGVGSVAGRAVNVGTGLSTMVDSFNPDLQYSDNRFLDRATRGLQFAGGAGDVATSTLSPGTLARAIATIAPGTAAQASAAAPSMASTLGNTLSRGGRAGGLAGAGAAATLALTGGLAEQHSYGVDAGGETLYKLHQMANSKDPETLQKARQKLYEIFQDSKSVDSINEMTNPGGWTRMGYNPTIGGTPFYDKRLNPEFGGLRNLISRIRKQDMPSLPDQHKYDGQALTQLGNNALLQSRSQSASRNNVSGF